MIIVTFVFISSNPLITRLWQSSTISIQWTYENSSNQLPIRHASMMELSNHSNGSFHLLLSIASMMIRSHFLSLDRAIKEKKESYNITDIAYDIKYTNPDDTTLRDKHNKILNTLTKAYWVHLVRCPECATINECSTDNSFGVECPKCNCKFTSNKAPDLFF